MGTRGVIARITENESFLGRYHHWDSYPTALGKTLWDVYHGHFKRDLNRMLKYLIDDHPAGWSTINDKDFSLAPGYRELFAGPCSVCGKVDWEHYYQYWKDHGRKITIRIQAQMDRGNYMALGHAFEKIPQIVGPECFCHGDRTEEGGPLLDHRTAQVSGCEWAYAFQDLGNGDGPEMRVLSSYCQNGDKMIGMFGMGDPDSIWRQVAAVPLGGMEPDWEALDPG